MFESSLAWFGRPPLSLAIATLAVLLLAVPLAAALTARALHTATPSAAAKHRRYSRTMLMLWSITALAVYALRLQGEMPSDIGLHMPHRPWQVPIGIVAVIALLALSGAWRNDVAPAYAERVRAVVPGSTADWIWFVPVALSAGICEEFLYRGYALTQLHQLTGSLALAVGASSAAFGLAHAYQGRFGIVGTALTGLLYAAIFIYSGSLLPCMLGHVVQDIAGGALLSRRLAATISIDRQLASSEGSPPSSQN